MLEKSNEFLSKKRLKRSIANQGKPKLRRSTGKINAWPISKRILPIQVYLESAMANDHC